jgi:hypothetical protein
MKHVYGSVAWQQREKIEDSEVIDSKDVSKHDALTTQLVFHVSAESSFLH